MSTRNLDAIFRPRSVALIGASATAGSVGEVLARNLLTAGFGGAVMLVNPRGGTLHGAPLHVDVAHLPEAPDLAVIATPPAGIPTVVAALAARGTRAAVVISAGFSGTAAARALRVDLLAAARPATLRVVGPNCLGVLAPGAGLNASFAQLHPPAGGIAFVAQSGALITAVLDWAAPRGIGFSAIASLGDMADVDFGDLLDYLADDRGTRAILLYIEAVTQARKFLSAARAAARGKPVIVVKAGRHAAGARAAASHTGALAGSDAVYDAAFRRAGMLRVKALEDLFDAVETLALARPPRGERLAILTNGGGMGVLATDALLDEHGVLAELGADTLRALDAVLPPTWSRGNPIDIIGDADGPRYAAAVSAALAAPEVDALLVLNCPTAITPGAVAARAVLDVLPRPLPKTVLTSWVGGEGTAAARGILRGAGVPGYESPEDAVRGFMQMVEYRRNQAELLHTPSSLPEDFTPDVATARARVAGALAEGREWLNEVEAKQVLTAYGIPAVVTAHAADAAAAAALAARIGGPVAVKIVSPDLTHKSDIGGVALDVEPGAVAAVAEDMAARIARRAPQARLQGFAVQPMVEREGASELICGVTTDAVFGPVMLFGAGGTAVEVLDDKALALPPLNADLARGLVARTRIARLLGGYRGVPAVDLDAIAGILVRLSQLVVDVPELVELDINPLLASPRGVVALDARVRIARATTSDRLAIRPYPRELEEPVVAADGRRLLLRPIRPEDEPALTATFGRLTPEEVRFRFFVPMRLLDHLTAARFTQIDYDRHMALVLTAAAGDGTPLIHGVVRLIEDPNRERAEFAILVEKSMTGQGLGTLLLERIIDYARGRGIVELHGDVLADNHRMLTLCRELGFDEEPERDEPGVVRVTLRPVEGA